MNLPRLLPRNRLLALVAVLAVASAGVVALRAPAAADCPPGTVPAHPEMDVAPDGQHVLAPQYRSGFQPEFDALARRAGCMFVSGPETFHELALRDAQQASVATAPFDAAAPGAALAAANQHQAMLQDPAPVRGADGTAAEYGQGPLNFDDPRYDSVNEQGIVDSTGRIDDFAYDPATNRLFAAIGTGGVWLSEDLGATWRPISDTMPTQVVGGVTYTPAGGADGTVAAVTGEHTFGGSSYTGLGAFWSDDLGETWNRAEGPLDGTLSFAIEVDPTDPEVIYAATGQGLWRSADAGRTYQDVVLPTGACAGDYNRDTCNFANYVTDVIVKTPGGVGEDTEGGTVLAAVGYRAGRLEDPDGTIHSEGNGLYLSATGEPGSFERIDGIDGAVGGQERLGRIELGAAVGPEQDHDIVYAMVEDAVLFNGGSPVQPIPEDPGDQGLSLNATVWNGVYFSDDFGASWTLLADDAEVAAACPVNQSVYCAPPLGVNPGVQSWYNMWVEPDPTRQLGGVPTRVMFGLEEPWRNRATAVPVDNESASFEVVGTYYGDPGCLFGMCTVTAPAGITTTHPDHHDAIWIPTVGEDGEPDGGVKLLVGHDGGLSSQTLTPSEEVTQDNWELEQENGLQTLLPYSAVWANDGTAYAGLQDNGHMRVAADEEFRQFETYFADGTFAAVDPENSDYAIESTQFANMNVTSDGGETWTDMQMPADPGTVRFVNPFVMDPLDPNHIVTGGQQVYESLAGPETDATEDWISVFDLGTNADSEPLVETELPRPFFQQTAIDVRGDAVYVGFCGVCDILNSPYPFENGIATNIGAEELPEAGTPAGWHKAAAEGLPNRYITSLAIDPYDETQRTIYVTLGGYSRSWVPPGAGGHEADDLGEGHIYKSTDAGETFVDISGNFPDTPALWVEPRGEQLLIGSNLGAYLSSDTQGGDYAPLPGFPTAPITSIQLKPDDPNRALLGLYGRSLWTYTFPEPSPVSVELRRLAGIDRIETAVRISEDVYDASETVTIARADVYADALAGAPLAFREDAPLLLTNSDGLSDLVAAEIERLGATRAVLFGGEVALTPQVEADLEAAGITEVERYGGPNRFDTARQIAEEVGGDDVYVVKGNDADPAQGWPDAMSIAPVAAQQQFPILLTETDRLPSETVAAIEAIGADRGRIVGGTVAVDTEVEAQLEESVRLGNRIAGADRFGTSVAAAQVGEDAGLSFANLWLARGSNFPDALSGGPTVAATGGVLLLVNDTNLDDSAASRDEIADRACEVRLARVLGGVEAIAPAVEDAVEALLGGCVIDDELPPPPDPAPMPGPGSSGGGEVVTGESFAGPYAFEEDEEGWTVETSEPGVPPTAWTRGDGGHESETSFQIMNYGELVMTSLVSPELEAPGGPIVLEWWNTFDIEGGGFDEVAVESSSDGGETWQTLQTLGGQNTGFPEFSVMRVELEPPAGPLQLRYLFYSDSICSSTGGPLCERQDGYEGVRIDDVTLISPTA